MNLIAEVFGAGNRLDRRGETYARRAALVIPHPLQVHQLDLSPRTDAAMPPNGVLVPGAGDRKLLLSGVLVALNQTNMVTGDTHWVVREDSPFFDFQPARLAEEHLGPWDKTVLPPMDFDRLADAFMSGLGNEQRLREYIFLAEELAPKMQVAPKRVHPLLANTEGPYRHLCRYFVRHNLKDYDCLVWIERSNNQLSKVRMEQLRLDEIPCIHLGGGWYAFESIEDAMALKLLADYTEVHPLHGE